jgi:FtsZ-binding cell division protein ZapB
MKKKVLELTTHNESLIKERQQSKMKILELKRKNNQLDANLKHIESARVET